LRMLTLAGSARVREHGSPGYCRLVQGTSNTAWFLRKPS
jgi:hypothetical protein